MNSLHSSKGAGTIRRAAFWVEAATLMVLSFVWRPLPEKQPADMARPFNTKETASPEGVLGASLGELFIRFMVLPYPYAAFFK